MMVTKDTVKKTKKPAKKPAKKAVKEVTAKEIFDNMFNPNSMWSMSCKVEDASIRIEQIKELLTLVAESMFDQKSNVVWLAADLLGNEIDKLNKIAEEIMELHRKQAQSLPDK